MFPSLFCFYADVFVESQMLETRKSLIASLGSVLGEMVRGFCFFFHVYLVCVQNLTIEQTHHLQEMKLVVWSLDEVVVSNSFSTRPELKLRFCSLNELQILLKEVLDSFRRDLQSKYDVLDGLKQLGTETGMLTSSTHDHLLIYLTIWDTSAYRDDKLISRLETILMNEISG